MKLLCALVTLGLLGCGGPAYHYEIDGCLQFDSYVALRVEALQYNSTLARRMMVDAGLVPDEAFCAEFHNIPQLVHLNDGWKTGKLTQDGSEEWADGNYQHDLTGHAWIDLGAVTHELLHELLHARDADRGINSLNHEGWIENGHMALAHAYLPLVRNPSPWPN